MSTAVFTKQNPSPAVTRRPPQIIEDTGNGSRRNENRRSLSVKLRDLFRKDSSASNRAANNNSRSPTAPMRQNSPSPGPVQPSTEAPHLRAPAISWPFGKKNTKSTTTTSTTKPSKTKKTKDNRKTKQTSLSPVKISSPVYEQENQTAIYGQHFVPRSPQLVHGNTERIQSSSSYDTTATTKGFRDYTMMDQNQRSQQVIVPDGDVFTPPAYISDRSRSPSMNRQRSPDYRYRYDNSTSPVSIPLADIEVIPTPQQKRKVDTTSPYTSTQRLAEKPPVSPQTSFRPSPYTTSNPPQWKSTSSSTLNNAGVRSTSSPSMDVDAPRMNAPSISFGTTSSKKKAKSSKSKSRPDGMTSSSTTISNLVQQNPVQPYQSWSSTYGSLPDAEMVYDSNLTSPKPSKPSTKAYPGLSAIVRHHLHPANVYYNDYSSAGRTTVPYRPQRFETSTTTLNEYEQNQPWSHPSIYDSAPSTVANPRHDGYIRPMTPQRPFIQADITITHVDLDDAHRRSPLPRPTHYDASESPTIYRSSTTIYTRDKHRYVDGGEIRTWSSQENAVDNDYQNSYKKPYTHVEVERARERQSDYYDHQVVPPKITNNDDDYRYSPRAHERDHYEKQQKVIEKKDQEEPEEEERYEVSFEYERQLQQSSYETQKHYEESYSSNRYSNQNEIGKTTQSSILNERDKIYDPSPRSYERTQGNPSFDSKTRYTVAPVQNFEPVIHNCTLRRTDSYDGLGIMISADSQTRLNHFIREVEPNSPGYQAGLRQNDRIISINGINVENVDFSNVLMLIKQGLDNDNLQISVIHQSEHR